MCTLRRLPNGEPRAPALRDGCGADAKVVPVIHAVGQVHDGGISGRHMIDDDVDETVVADKIRGLPERITTSGERIAGARNARHDLYFLPSGEGTTRHH